MFLSSGFLYRTFTALRAITTLLKGSWGVLVQAKVVHPSDMPDTLILGCRFVSIITFSTVISSMTSLATTSAEPDKGLNSSNLEGAQWVSLQG